jgi:hypothetical protein
MRKEEDEAHDLRDSETSGQDETMRDRRKRDHDNVQAEI